MAFDLWTGRWLFLDARDRGIPAWQTSLCLVCTFMAGPFGLLLYVILRWYGEKGKRALIRSEQ